MWYHWHSILCIALGYKWCYRLNGGLRKKYSVGMIFFLRLTLSLRVFYSVLESTLFGSYVFLYLLKLLFSEMIVVLHVSLLTYYCCSFNSLLVYECCLTSNSNWTDRDLSIRLCYLLKMIHGFELLKIYLALTFLSEYFWELSVFIS